MINQAEPDFDVKLSADDVTTSVVLGTLDLAEPTRDRYATHRLPESKSLGEVF